MKSQRFKPLLYRRKGNQLSLSGKSLIKLLKTVLNKGKDFRFMAKGFSMSPFIKDGDVITLSQLNSSLLGVGRVVAIVYPKTGKLVVHRVIVKRGSFYTVKGDNLPDMDVPVLRADIRGYVTKVERNGRRVLFGLGPERLLIAFLNRRRLLTPLINICRNIRYFLLVKRRSTKLTNDY